MYVTNTLSISADPKSDGKKVASPETSGKEEPVAEVLVERLKRGQVRVPISPNRTPTDLLLYRHHSEPREFYLPRYAIDRENVSGEPRYRILFEQRDDSWALTVHFAKHPAPELEGRIAEAEELDHTLQIRLRHATPGGGQATDRQFTEIEQTDTGVSAKLLMADLPTRDAVFRAMTAIDSSAQLIVLRRIEVAVPLPRSTVRPRPPTRVGSHMVVLNKVDRSKAKVIKVVQRRTGLSAQKSQALVQKRLPVVLLSRVSIEAAKVFQRELTQVGATAIIKNLQARLPQNRLPARRIPGLIDDFRPRGDVDADPSRLKPKLSYLGKQTQQIRGKTFTRFNIGVTNWQQFPNALFVKAPDLPPCGNNQNSSRTWLDIHDNRNKRLYGYCALSSNRQLIKLSFAVAQGAAIPSSARITLKDRRANAKYQSDLVALREPPPPAEQLYQVVRPHLSLVPEPQPFVFDTTVHAYIFAFLDGGGSAAGLIRDQLKWESRFYPYFVDSSRRNVVYYLPDEFKLSRWDGLLHSPQMSVRVASRDGVDDEFDVSLAYTVLPEVSSARLSEAAETFSERLNDDAPPISMQPLPVMDFSFHVSYPTGHGETSEERDVQSDILYSGIHDSLSMPLSDFVPLFAAMTGESAARFHGSVRITVPGVGEEAVPFIAQLDNLTGDLFEYGAVEDDDGSIDVTLMNAIESPISINGLTCTVTRQDEQLNAVIETNALPAESLAPGDSILLRVVPERPLPGEGAIRVDFDLSEVTVNLDKQSVWNVILDRATTEYFRLITARAEAHFFEARAGREDEQISSILVHFEGGDSVELTADILTSNARIDYSIDAVVLGEAIDMTYRYSYDVNRRRGPDPRSEEREDDVEMFTVPVVV